MIFFCKLISIFFVKSSCQHQNCVKLCFHEFFDTIFFMSNQSCQAPKQCKTIVFSRFFFNFNFYEWMLGITSFFVFWAVVFKLDRSSKTRSFQINVQCSPRCLKITEKGLIQHCERSELRLHFESTTVH